METYEAAVRELAEADQCFLTSNAAGPSNQYRPDRFSSNAARGETGDRDANHRWHSGWLIGSAAR